MTGGSLPGTGASHEIALVVPVMAILILVLFNVYTGVAMGIVAGAGVGSGVGRWRSRRGDLLPSH